MCPLAANGGEKCRTIYICISFLRAVVVVLVVSVIILIHFVVVIFSLRMYAQQVLTNDYLQELASVHINKYSSDHAVVGTAFATAILSVAGQIHHEFLCLLRILADKQTRKYYALISAKEEISSEAFTWSRARTFIFNKDSIVKALAYATAKHLHLSAHSTAPPARRQAGQHMSSSGDTLRLGTWLGQGR